MKHTVRLTEELRYRIAFVRHCADRADADVTRAKVELADALLAAVAPARRLARLSGLRLRPAAVALQQKRRRA